MTKPKFKEQLSNEEQIENIIKRANKEIEEEEKGLITHGPRIKKVNILFNNFIVDLNEEISKLHIIFPTHKAFSTKKINFISTRVQLINKEIIISCVPLDCLNNFRCYIYIGPKFQGTANDPNTAIGLLKSVFVGHYKSLIRKNNKND